MDRRQWSRAAWALAAVFGSLPVVGRVVMGDWEFVSALEIACLLALTGTYLHLRARRFATKPDPATLLDSANQLAMNGRIDSAIAMLTRIIRQSPKLWQAYQYRGQLHLHRGESALAAEDFGTAIRLAPGEQHLYELLDQAQKALDAR